VGILIFTRLGGLRSCSKMAASDFAMTIAIGLLFGATVSQPSPTLAMGWFALLCVFAGQWVLARLRTPSRGFAALVDNEPVLLMAGSRILHTNLKRANLSECDWFGKLREAGTTRRDQVRGVVFETTGDVSVLLNDSETELDEEIFANVLDWELLFSGRGRSRPR
jgi:uncharacterized membrane protein YcaP (DUF421 family)